MGCTTHYRWRGGGIYSLSHKMRSEPQKLLAQALRYRYRIMCPSINQPFSKPQPRFGDKLTLIPSKILAKTGVSAVPKKSCEINDCFVEKLCRRDWDVGVIEMRRAARRGHSSSSSSSSTFWPKVFSDQRELPSQPSIQFYVLHKKKLVEHLMSRPCDCSSIGPRSLLYLIRTSSKGSFFLVELLNHWRRLGKNRC